MILVTGASGHVGGGVARALAQAGPPLRLLVRDPARAPTLPGAEVAIGDYADRSALDAAMRGVTTVFLTSVGAAPLKRAGLHGNVIDAAAAAGVERLVYLSFQGASATSPFPYSADHLLTEAHLKQSGLAWTILRDSFYQELVPELAGANGLVRDPGGDGKVAWVSRADVVRMAVAVLIQPGHEGRSYEVTGPEALSLEEAVAIVVARRDAMLRYERETIDEGRAWRAATGASEWEVEVWLGSYLAMGSGELAKVSSAVAEVTGTPPRSMREG